MMTDDADLTEDDIRAFLAVRPSTLPRSLTPFRGIDEAIGQALFEAFNPLADAMSRFVSLHGLDGITIAAD